ncbi:hypothetical protein [Mycolicibacterium vinylchloridicum]|uniref:hypothetical protein n=1 Tax=Mycolicibacterium vinylchloridicum TaxID=2736928 RepID=UPI0015CE037D|nr:hypothetical protein [Mycolicibacterium vinylchloridicum]
MRTSFLSSSAATAIVALSVAPLAPPVEARIATVTAPDIELAATPIGALPLAFLRNQLTFCSLICPFIAQGAVTVPIGVAQAPGTFLQTLLQTGDLAGSLGAAVSAVTIPADAAAEGIIGNDLNLVLPKAQNTLEVAVVQLMDVFAGQTTPSAARDTILAALDQPPGIPTVPVGAHGLLQVATVEAINVGSAVAFQAFETVLLGVVHSANAAATTLASTHSMRAAIMAGMDSVRATLTTARNQLSTAVDNAITNIRAAAGHPVSAAVKAQRQVGHADKAGRGVAHRADGVHRLHRGSHTG